MEVNLMRFERRGSGSYGGGGGRGFGGGGRRFGGPREDLPKPVKVGEEYDVEINEVGSKGDGIARIKNFVVFINGVKQGEKTKIRITDVRDRFAIGEKAGAASESTSESAGTDAAAEGSETVKGTAEDEGEEEGEKPDEEEEG